MKPTFTLLNGLEAQEYSIRIGSPIPRVIGMQRKFTNNLNTFEIEKAN